MNNLIEKGDVLAQWIINHARNDSQAIIKAIKNGDLDLVDHKIQFKEEMNWKIFHEFMFLNFHLADLYVYQVAKEKRAEFTDYVIEKVRKSIGIEDKEYDAFVNTYNNRMQVFSQYHTLMGKEEQAGTLFWEFGKRIANLIDDQSGLLTLILMTKSLVASSYVDLWKLELLHRRKDL